MSHKSVIFMYQAEIINTCSTLMRYITCIPFFSSNQKVSNIDISNNFTNLFLLIYQVFFSQHYEKRDSHAVVP